MLVHQSRQTPCGQKLTRYKRLTWWTKITLNSYAGFQTFYQPSPHPPSHTHTQVSLKNTFLAPKPRSFSLSLSGFVFPSTVPVVCT